MTANDPNNILKFIDDEPAKPEEDLKTWKVLIVDDEPDVHSVTRYALSDMVFSGRAIQFLSAFSAREAIEILTSHSDIALVLLDVVMEKEDDGFVVIKHIREKLGNRMTRIILRTGHPGQAPETNVIVDYDINDYKAKTELTKEKLLTSVIASLRSYEFLSSILADKEQIRQEIEHLKENLPNVELANSQAFSGIISANAKMLSLFRYIEITASSPRPILITGETGVGKELVAKVIHQLSRCAGKMVTVNAAGLDDNLFSDTLFGHQKGAFTGAINDRKGLIEAAQDGILFLDEIGDLSAESQVKLLRLLQDHEYYKLGSDKPRSSNSRIVAATHHDLGTLAEQGKFRQDLYYRLQIHHIHIPPLRERIDDVPLLIKHFMRLVSKELQRPSPKITNECIQLLQEYDFPGNIRELEGIIFDVVNQSTNGNLALLELMRKRVTPSSKSHKPKIDVNHRKYNLEVTMGSDFPTLNEVTEHVIKQALDFTNGNLTVAAKLLGISRQTLSYKAKKLHINHDNHKPLQ